MLSLGVRPEHLPAAGNGANGQILTGTVDLIEALGYHGASAVVVSAHGSALGLGIFKGG